MRNKNLAIIVTIATIIIGSLASCKGGRKNAADDPGKDAASTKSTPASKEKAAFNPFRIMIVRQTVADYEKWEPLYEEHLPVRKKYGQTDLDLLLNIERPSEVMIVEKIDDLKLAKDFSILPDLKADMKKAGATGAVTFNFIDILRNDDSDVGTDNRILMTHRVKDFDSWLKAYDAEGKAARAKDGMMDRAIGRDIDDPNIVYVLLAVSNLAQAKVAITSEVKMKAMTSAGVEGVPTIEYFMSVDNE